MSITLIDATAGGIMARRFRLRVHITSGKLIVQHEDGPENFYLITEFRSLTKKLQALLAQIPSASPDDKHAYQSAYEGKELSMSLPTFTWSNIGPSSCVQWESPVHPTRKQQKIYNEAVDLVMSFVSKWENEN
jgi:hypothetical protein